MGHLATAVVYAEAIAPMWRTMYTLILAATAAAPLSIQAQERIDAGGRFVATYVKESNQDPTLELHHRGSGEATLHATGPDGVYSVSVDQSHVRMRIDPETCASVPAKALLEQMQKLGMPHEPSAPPTPRLIYRAAEGSQVEIATAFQGIPSPVLFSWHADLDDAQVAVEKGSWEATNVMSSWKISRKTGLLERMTVGDNALVLKEAVIGKKAEPIAAADICPKSTAPALERQLSTQLKMNALPGALTEIAARWPELDTPARESAVAMYSTWWEGFVDDELPMWAEGISKAPWHTRLVTDMTDLEAFDAFRAQLPEEKRPEAVTLWKHAWFDQIGRNMLKSHHTEIGDTVAQGLPSPIEPALARVLVLEPLQKALLSRGESTIQLLVVPVLEQGGSKLQALLDAR